MATEPTVALYVRIPEALRAQLDARLKVANEGHRRVKMNALVRNLLAAGLDLDAAAAAQRTARERSVIRKAPRRKEVRK